MPIGVMPEFIGPSSLESSVTRYWFDGAVGDRRFCKTCGCHIGDYVESLNMWYIAPALLSKDESVFVLDEHIFTLSAPKGLYDWVPQIGSRPLKITNPTDGTADPEIPEVLRDSTGEERLLCKCHCGGVSFTIQRPTTEILADQKLKHFVSNGQKLKWNAYLDGSHETRLSNGVHIGAWVSVTSSACEPMIGPELQIGSAVKFASSSGKIRSFCGVCGATLFRVRCLPDGSADRLIIDISLGIVRAPDGVRAGKWVAWGADEFEDIDQGLQYDKELFTSLYDGFKTWVVSVEDGKDD